MTIIRKDVKKGIRRGNSIDYFFCCRYSTSAYTSCQHACIYCDGRAEKYFVEGDFGSEITARSNIAEVVEKDLSLLPEKGSILLGSGITDSYQPIEAELGLTRKIIETIYSHSNSQPVMILTKSSIARRDIDILEKLNKKKGVIFAMTITATDEKLREIFEPGASSYSERFETIKAMKSAGIPSGIFAMPLLPMLSDQPDQVENLYIEAKKAGADFLSPAGLTLRPGCQKELYLKTLKKEFPELLKDTEKIYKENRQSGSPAGSYSKKIYKNRPDFSKKYDIPTLIPPEIYYKVVSIVDFFELEMGRLNREYKYKGVDLSNLKSAHYRYRTWLGDLRKSSNRKRSLGFGYPDDQLIFTINTGALPELLNNEKLADHLTKLYKKYYESVSSTK